MSAQRDQHQPFLSHSPVVSASLSQPPVATPSWVPSPVVLVPTIQPPLVIQQYYQPPAQTPVVVSVQRPQPSFLLRVVWFVCIGYGLGFFWLTMGYVLCLTLVLLPVGLWMLDRLPTVLTLRPRSDQTTVALSNGVLQITVGPPQQRSFLVRAVYYVLVGWWLAGIWALIGYILCVLLIPLPLGLMMLNRLPAVLTLRRN